MPSALPSEAVARHGLSGRAEWVPGHVMESENKAWRNNQQISLVLGDFELCLYSISKVCFVCLKNPVIQQPGIALPSLAVLNRSGAACGPLFRGAVITPLPKLQLHLTDRIRSNSYWRGKKKGRPIWLSDCGYIHKAFSKKKKRERRKKKKKLLPS